MPQARVATMANRLSARVSSGGSPSTSCTTGKNCAQTSEKTPSGMTSSQRRRVATETAARTDGPLALAENVASKEVASATGIGQRRRRKVRPSASTPKARSSATRSSPWPSSTLIQTTTLTAMTTASRQTWLHGRSAGWYADGSARSWGCHSTRAG
jgi:hypothetical protein